MSLKERDNLMRLNRRRIGDIAEIMLDYFEHSKTFQTDKMMTVAAASYTDPELWRAEMDRIFKRVPLMLALSCEMSKAGDYKAMEVAGLPILISRDKAGTARTFLNVCAHGWAAVAEEGYGSCGAFTCRFHGWTYGTDGQLIGVADHAKFGEIDRFTRGLRELPCEERNGMIFACLTPGILLNLDEYYGAQLEEFADSGLKDFTFLGSRMLESVNWKIPINNFIENYHFATLHPDTVFLIYLSSIVHYERFGPNMRIGFPKRSIAKLREVPREQWSEQENQAYAFMRFFFPNVTGFITRGDISIFTQTFRGPDPDKSRIVLLYARQNPLKDEADREDMENQISVSSRTIEYEDLPSSAQIQKRLESGAYDSLLYGRNEAGNQYFQKWLDWYLRGGDPTSAKPTM